MPINGMSSILNSAGLRTETFIKFYSHPAHCLMIRDSTRNLG
ncbi:hypothetical protein LSH36_935g00013 [Paralvinella palmiformis]|uniref:Uncharacterized protein n=1 Tax=Paralvinella palmiformis TaxID=53620 RepID=A0AAD9IXU6_9ANNE|nr:hypothetical protein LSH36_935g00013 [Paralvinella palmiformis]